MDMRNISRNAWCFFEQHLRVGQVSNELFIHQTVSHIVRYQPTIVKVPVDVFLRMYHDDLFLTANVSSWLFDGIDDPVLDIAGRFPNLPIHIPYDKFGWFYNVSTASRFIEV